MKSKSTQIRETNYTNNFVSHNENYTKFLCVKKKDILFSMKRRNDTTNKSNVIIRCRFREDLKSETYSKNVSKCISYLRRTYFILHIYSAYDSFALKSINHIISINCLYPLPPGWQWQELWETRL